MGAREQQIEGAGVELRVVRHGPEDVRGGDVVVVVHDLADGAGAAAPVAAVLGDDAAVVGYDRRGYGGSGAPEPFGATTVEEQTQDAVALADGLGLGAATWAGAGFGALVVLDLLKRHSGRVTRAVLLDAPLLALVPDGAEAIGTQRVILDEALREGLGPAGAVERWLGRDADPARLALATMPGSARAFFADFAGLASWPVTRGALRAVRQEVVVATSPGAPAVLLGAADALAALLPAARRVAGVDLAAAARA